MFSNLNTENIINQVVHYELTKAQILPVDAATIVAALNKICTRLIGLHVAMCNAHLRPCLLLHFIAVISAKCINSNTQVTFEEQGCKYEAQNKI